jgi:hypothetical protein
MDLKRMLFTYYTMKIVVKPALNREILEYIRRTLDDWLIPLPDPLICNSGSDGNSQ